MHLTLLGTEQFLCKSPANLDRLMAQIILRGNALVGSVSVIEGADHNNIVHTLASSVLVSTLLYGAHIADIEL